MNIISRIKLIVSGYPEEQIIEVLGKTGYANVKDTKKLVTKYLENEYPLSDINSRGIKSAICDSILDGVVEIELLKNYSINNIEDLSVFNTERYRPLLKQMVKAGIEPYEIIKRFNLSDFDKEDLSSLKANELYELYNSSKNEVFVQALEGKDVIELLELYRNTKGKRDERVSHKIIDKAYKEYKGIAISYTDPEDMPYLANKLIKEKDLEGILNAYGKFAPDSEPRRKFRQFLVGSEQKAGEERKYNDDGEFTFKILTTVSDLTDEERKTLNNKMNNVNTCPNMEYRIYWMFGDKTPEELKGINNDAIVAAILFLQDSKNYKNKELAEKVLKSLLETQGETVNGFIDIAINGYDEDQKKKSETSQIQTNNIGPSTDGSRKGFFRGLRNGNK